MSDVKLVSGRHLRYAVMVGVLAPVVLLAACAPAPAPPPPPPPQPMAAPAPPPPPPAPVVRG